MSSVYFDPGPPAKSGERKVLLATPSYSSPACTYVFSIACSREAMHKVGLPTAYLLLEGNCHLDDARNAIVRDFLASDCMELVFLDADVSWRPEQLVELCRFDCDIVGGVYPYRRENDGENMPVRGLPDAHMKDGLIEVEGLPAGFLRIRRRVLERMAAAAQKFHGRGSQAPIPLVFERDIHGDGRRSADIRFCMRWREMGGRVWAACELDLGHAGGTICRDSLGAWLRRRAGVSIRYVVEQIRKGRADPRLFAEAREATGNKRWNALEDVLSLCALLKADGPILEAGSGLTTVVLAAAHPDQIVWCLEDEPLLAEHTKTMALSAGVRNIAICRQPIGGGWYDLSDLDGEFPERFALGLNDGPSRMKASRMGFFERFGDRVDVIVADDADDLPYREAMAAWASQAGRSIELVGNRAALIRRT